ncbi:hypothetical protein [Paraburkholderia fungorum]|uniref:hypothetical protein n=1 Tax=Paraburkholderia fungorum TaxID=134537 RepID=UPI000B1FD3AB|nr:hypothetical protein [Paraburkholderia fungorum]
MSDNTQKVEEPTEAYEAGCRAFEEGADLDTGNSYPKLSYDWHDWQSGWCDTANED